MQRRITAMDKKSLDLLEKVFAVEIDIFVADPAERKHYGLFQTRCQAG